MRFDFIRLLRSWFRYRVRRFAYSGLDLIAPLVIVVLLILLLKKII